MVECGRRLSEGGKTPSRSSPSLEQKLEKKLGGFGTDSGVNPAQSHGKAKQPRQRGQATPAHQLPSHDGRSTLAGPSLSLLLCQLCAILIIASARH